MANCEIKTYYRISGYSKIKEGQLYNWKICLNNFIKHFPIDTITFIADNASSEILEYLHTHTSNIHVKNLGNSSSFKYAIELALKNSDPLIYFVEDDYLHRDNSAKVLSEGLQIADYVSLYDHADKYSSDYCKNSWGGESCKVLITKHTHWKTVSSTCMTFATSKQMLEQDYDVINKYLSGPVPEDWAMFNDLKSRGRNLITPLPGYATHCIKEYVSPLIDWNYHAEKL